MQTLTRNELESLFVKSYSDIVTNPVFQRFLGRESLQIDICQNIHRDECIDLVCDQFCGRNALRQLLGATREDCLPASTKLVDRAIKTKMTIITQDTKSKSKYNPNYNKIIAITNLYDICDMADSDTHFNRKKAMLEIKNKLNKTNTDNITSEINPNATIFKYLVKSYEFGIDNVFQSFVRICHKNNSNSDNYGECGYFDAGTVDINYAGKKYSQILNAALAHSIQLGMGYKYSLARVTDPITIHITTKSKKWFDKSGINEKCNGFFISRKKWDYSNDEIFKQYMYKRFGKQATLKRMKQYGTVMTGGYYNTTNICHLHNKKMTSWDYFMLLVQSMGVQSYFHGQVQCTSPQSKL